MSYEIASLLLSYSQLLDLQCQLLNLQYRLPDLQCQLLDLQCQLLDLQCLWNTVDDIHFAQVDEEPEEVIENAEAEIVEPNQVVTSCLCSWLNAKVLVEVFDVCAFTTMVLHTYNYICLQQCVVMCIA